MVVVCKETSQSSIDLIHRETGFMLCYFKTSTLTYQYLHVYTYNVHIQLWIHLNKTTIKHHKK